MPSGRASETQPADMAFEFAKLGDLWEKTTKTTGKTEAHRPRSRYYGEVEER